MATMLICLLTIVAILKVIKALEKINKIKKRAEKDIGGDDEKFNGRKNTKDKLKLGKIAVS